MYAVAPTTTISPPASARSVLRWRETQNAEAIQMTSENRLLSEALSVLSAPFDGSLDCSAIEFPSPGVYSRTIRRRSLAGAGSLDCLFIGRGGLRKPVPLQR